MDSEQGGVVTPEAVVLDFKTANVGSRALARGIDLLGQAIALAIFVQIAAIGAGFTGSDTALVVVTIVSLIVTFLVLFGYPVAFETWWNGQTPGKALVGLRVLTKEGGPIRFRHAAVRTLIGFIEVLVMAFVAVLSTALSRTNQRVGDMAAGTIVVRERTAGGQSTTVSYPPPAGLDSYVRTLDVSHVDQRQYGVVRGFLLRVDELRPSVRAAMAVRLANPLAVQMRHDPPAGLSPEVFLVCVASAYQVRHGGPGAVWSAPGWSGYGLPKGWGFPPGYNGLTPLPIAGWGAPAWGAPTWGPAPAPGRGQAPSPGAPAPGWGQPPSGQPAPGPGAGWGEPHAPPGGPHDGERR